MVPADGDLFPVGQGNHVDRNPHFIGFLVEVPVLENCIRRLYFVELVESVLESFVPKLVVDGLPAQVALGLEEGVEEAVGRLVLPHIVAHPVLQALEVHELD